MRRLLLVVSTLALAVGLAGPAKADHTNNWACSGYQTTARVITAAGNDYQSRTNICVAWSPYTTSSMWADAVVRKQCFRNGVPYGDGTGGCRWTGRVEHHGNSNLVGWYEINVNNWCVTCGGAYVQDSGRIYTQPEHQMQTREEQNLATRAKSEGGQVRFYLADGSTRLLDEVSVYSPEIFVP
jgi:hypothetical protein